MDDIVIRNSRPSDAAALSALAELDSTPDFLLEGELLLAVTVDSRLLAAFDPATGRAIADPFERTALVVDLLAMRSRHLAQPRPAGRMLRAVKRLPVRLAGLAG